MPFSFGPNGSSFVVTVGGVSNWLIMHFHVVVTALMATTLGGHP